MGSAHPLLAKWHSSVADVSGITLAVKPSRMDEMSSVYAKNSVSE